MLHGPVLYGKTGTKQAIVSAKPKHIVLKEATVTKHGYDITVILSKQQQKYSKLCQKHCLPLSGPR